VGRVINDTTTCCEWIPLGNIPGKCGEVFAAFRAQIDKTGLFPDLGMPANRSASQCATKGALPNRTC
jgi:hypothetical protein